MNPDIQPLDQPSESTDQVVVNQSEVTNPPEQKTRVKGLNKKLLLITVIAVAIIVAGMVFYIVFNVMNKKPAESSKNQTETSQTNTSSSNINAAVNSLTDGATKESSLTNTDNTAAATDASSAAGKVGDVVDENNL